jgi:hypothetical protein
MLKALYYPHTEIGNQTILKNALLLWDNIETIVPFHGWVSSKPSDKKLIREAIDLVVEPRVPTDTERHTAHKTLEEFTESGFLASLVEVSPKRLHGGKEYLVYPQKFLDRTWDILQQHGVARWVQHEDDFGVPAAVGFLMMSILADVCAGTQIRKVTDRTDAYNWLSKMRAKLLGSQYITGLDPSQVAPGHDRLVALSLEVLDGREIPLSKLVELRKKEVRRGGSEYSAMRRRYLEKLDACLTLIGEQAKSESDVREIERQFKNDIKQEIADLKTELGIANSKALFSKEVALSIIILAGSLVSPIAGLTTLATTVGGVGIIPLMKAAVDYRAARRDALRKHAMSWLYVAKQRRMTLR